MGHRNSVELLKKDTRSPSISVEFFKKDVRGPIDCAELLKKTKTTAEIL